VRDQLKVTICRYG